MRGKIIKRGIWEKLVSELAKREFTFLLGPRQVGKTTLVKELIEHLRRRGVNRASIFYYN